MGLTNEQVRTMLVKDLKEKYGTQKEMADAIGISPAYLHDLLNGKRAPAGDTLKYLGLERVITYRVVSQ